MREFEGIMAALALSRAGSYRAAVRETGQSFKTLNKRIGTLEEGLGFPVFHTTRNGLIATQEGKAVIAEAERIEEGLNRLRLIAKHTLSTAVSEFTISATPAIGTFWLLPRIAEFEAANPLIRLKFVGYEPGGANAGANADINLQYSVPAAPEMMRKKIGYIHGVLCASESYLAANGTPVTRESLAGHKFAVLNPGWFSQCDLIEAYTGRPMNPSNVVVVETSAIHLLAVEYAAGISMMPTFIFAAGSNLKPLDMDVHFTMDNWMCYSADARQNPRLSQTIDWLEQMFDPRSNPWFRREFIHPREFPSLIEKMETRGNSGIHKLTGVA